MKRDCIEPMTCQEIAEVLGISRQSVDQIEKKALRKLRNQGKLEEFLILFDDREDYFGEKYYAN